MEADWEVEIGPDAPLIDAFWPGLVDLRTNPQLAHTLAETETVPTLADVLQKLNSPASPIWTAKCDVWSLSQEEFQDSGFDPLEMACSPASAQQAWACYIDLLPAGNNSWTAPEATIAWSKALCGQLHTLPLNCSRADLIIRSAVIPASDHALGITAYLTACGPTSEHAKRTLQAALEAFADAVSSTRR